VAAGGLEPGQRASVVAPLVRILDVSLTPRFQPERVRRYLSALAEAGNSERLGEVAGNAAEQLQELGLARYMESFLREQSERTDIAPDEQFWLLDALAFWQVQAGNRPGASAIVEQMDELVVQHAVGGRAATALLMKHLHLCALKGDITGMAALEQRPEVAGLSTQAQRIFRYNVATGLFRAGRYGEVEQAMERMIDEYYDELGLDPAAVVGASHARVASMLEKSPHDPDDVKRLADCLDLYAKAVSEQGRPSGLARIHAVKFFQLSGSFRSAVNTGQDFVEEVLSFLDDPHEARRFMEDVLIPIVRDLELHEHVLSVHAQYAAVLAYCGEIALARAELERLRPYVAGASPEGQAEFSRQVRIVESVAVRPRVNAPPRIIFRARLPPSRPLVGRNSSCPCGSGRKFKRCCGSLAPE